MVRDDLFSKAPIKKAILRPPFFNLVMGLAQSKYQKQKPKALVLDFNQALGFKSHQGKRISSQGNHRSRISSLHAQYPIA